MPINWNNLEPLPLKRQRDAGDRERLAAVAHRNACAKHKGRNHWRNWERRAMISEKKAAAKVKAAVKLAAHHRHTERVRLYWLGEIDSHP